MVRSRIGMRLSLLLGIVMIPLLVSGLIWLDRMERHSMTREAEQYAEQSGLVVVSSLKTIMLSGEGTVAHAWLQRIRESTQFSQIRIYRRDGHEAFVDNQTIDHVDIWQKRFHFVRRPTAPVAAVIDPHWLAPLAKASAGIESKILDQGQLTLLLPITLEPACLSCHGYDPASVRGVLQLSIPMQSLTQRQDVLRWKILWSVLGFIGTVGMLLMGLVMREVIRPIIRLQASAQRMGESDTWVDPMSLERRDELGDLARSYHDLLMRLKDQTVRQIRLSEAVIALSRELVDEVVLKKIGELAMQLTGARYVMLSYLKEGEKRFLPMGMDESSMAKMQGQWPQGKGLLGILWNERKILRLDCIAQHPQSSGFPAGHPAMTSFLGVPIDFAGEMIGALYLTDKRGGEPFTEEDESIVRMLASSCAVALSNAQQFERLQQANHELIERTSDLKGSNRLLRTREIELELMNEELRHASEAKNQFLANTSHELRTPLNAIIGFSDLLLVQTGDMPTKHRDYIEHVNVSGKRLLELINSLLDLSKIEAGMLEIHHEPVIPGTILRFIVNHLKPLYDKKRQQVHLVIPEGELTTYLDGGKLQQVWVNLIGNAIKFTPEEGQIEVGFSIQGQHGDGVLDGWVRDNGIGIASADIERIFHPFVQAEGGLTREYGGTGLGLTLVRRLLEMQGGSIRVESRVGEGSLFAFSLPVRLVEGPANGLIPVELLPSEDQSRLPMEVVEDTVGELANLPVILIVDEDKGRAAAVSDLLREEGYQGELSDLLHVEQLAEEMSPFLIMVGIPEDPVDIYRQLHQLRSRKATRHIPLVLLGGEADCPSFSLGTVDTMDKRVSKNELVDLITRHGRQSPHAPGLTVLVIDDEAIVREYIKECLRGHGYRLLLAANGRDGIQAAIEHDPDLIILDLMMPGMSGFEVVEELKRHPTACDIPVVIFSAKDLTREEVMQLGQEVEKVLTKGNTGRADLLRELRSMELLYPVQARLMDSVLRCYNLRYRQLRLMQECNRADRYGQTFALVGWQLEGYETHVQKYGQHWGVAALREIVELVNAVTREGDVLVRSGESSFMLILTGTTLDVAERVAEKLRLRIRVHKFPLAGSEVGHFTASFGCVQFGHDGQKPEALIGRLNLRLAQALERGGDQCICSDEEE